jgi:hypothetical protein
VTSLAPLPTSRIVVTLLVGVAALGGLVVAERRAFADDPSPRPAPVAKSAAAELTADEVAAIRRRAPDWDRLDESKRERIAAFVLKLRTLSSEERDRLLDRLRKVHDVGPGAVDKFRPGLAIHFVARGVSALVLAEVGPDAQRVVGPDGPLTKDERERLQAAIGASWWRHVIEALVATPDLAIEPSPSMPDGPATELRTMRDEVRQAGGAAAPEKMRRRFAERVFQARLFEWKQGMPKPEAGAVDEHLLALGRRIKGAFPSAFAAAVADVAKAAVAGRDGIEKFVGGYQPEPQPAGPRLIGGAWQLLRELERHRPQFGGAAAADILAKLDELETSILRLLGVPDVKIKELRATAAFDRHFALFQEIMEQYGPLGGGRTRVFPPSRRGGAPGGGMDGGMDGSGMGDGAMGDGAMEGDKRDDDKQDGGK